LLFFGAVVFATLSKKEGHQLYQSRKEFYEHLGTKPTRAPANAATAAVTGS